MENYTTHIYAKMANCLFKFDQQELFIDLATLFYLNE